MRNAAWCGAGVVFAAMLLLGCSMNGGEGGGGETSEGDDFDGSDDSEQPREGTCDGSDYEGAVIDFCKKQFPAEPGTRELGASCSYDEDCDSGFCLEPYGQPAFCSRECSNVDCPTGFECEDTGYELACYTTICIYGGSDKSDCVSSTIDELDAACESGCNDDTIERWIQCLAEAPLLCDNSEASDACGIERGLLDECCVGCDYGW